MNNRVTVGSRADRADRIEFGLLGWLEQTRVRLPLQGVDCRFQVCGEVASVEIDQVFFQSNRQPINCTYTFPLPGGAAVYRCEVQIGNRTIHARVEEEQKARAMFKEKIRAGYRASLVEMERENLFTLSLGNLQPNDRIMVRLAYFQTVDRTGPELSLLIPFCPGVRYIPGEPLWRESTGQGSNWTPTRCRMPHASLRRASRRVTKRLRCCKLKARLIWAELTRPVSAALCTPFLPGKTRRLCGLRFS